MGDFLSFFFERRRYMAGKKPRIKERINQGIILGKPRVKPMKKEYLKSPPPLSLIHI